MAPEYFYPLLGATFALAWGVLATVRWFIKARLEADRRDSAPHEGVGEERLAFLEGRVHELEERLDFAERVLTQSRQDRLGTGREPGS